MDFLELCQKTRQECGVQGQGPAAVTDQTGILLRIVDWVRDADLFIQAIHPDWDFLWSEFSEDTVTDSDAMAKPADLGQWDREAFAVNRGTTNGKALRVMTFEKWRLNNNIKTANEPYAVTIKPDGSLVFPVPANATYPVYGNYWRAPIPLTANTDTPPYPARYHRMIIAKAKMWFFEDIESVEQWKQAEKEYDEWLVELESHALPNQQEANQSSPAMMAVRPV